MLPSSIQKLIDHFAKLPGIGIKTATRFTFWLMAQSEEEIQSFARAILQLQENLHYCQRCYNLSDRKNCSICMDPRRDQSKIMAVEKPIDIKIIEETGAYKGLYHVLGGLVVPIDGIGPKQIKIKELFQRIARSSGPKEIKELILATNPSTEGETTALYISQAIAKLKKMGKIKKELQITRLAQGLPVGGDLEYADEVTLRKSLEGRRKY